MSNTSNSLTVKIEVNLGALRTAHGSLLLQVREAEKKARKVSDPRLKVLIMKQAKSFQDAADELIRAMDSMVVA